jgi:hypothetical protein
MGWPAQTEFFFLALLPPIMFEAGFSLQVKPFFRNIGAIAAMAFAGTVVSTAIVGLVMCAHDVLLPSTGAGRTPGEQPFQTHLQSSKTP